MTQVAGATEPTVVARLSSTAGQVSRARILMHDNFITSPVLEGISVTTPDPSTTPAVDLTLTNNHVDIMTAAGPRSVTIEPTQSGVNLCARVGVGPAGHLPYMGNVFHRVPTEGVGGPVAHRPGRRRDLPARTRRRDARGHAVGRASGERCRSGSQCPSARIRRRRNHRRRRERHLPGAVIGLGSRVGRLLSQELARFGSRRGRRVVSLRRAPIGRRLQPPLQAAPAPRTPPPSVPSRLTSRSRAFARSDRLSVPSR